MLLFTPLVLAASALAVPNRANKLKGSIIPPREWINLGDAPADHIISLRIALPQSNFKALEQHLYEVSDPFHSRYGQHLSKAEVEALVAPHQDSVDAVSLWLLEHGIGEDEISRSAAGDWVNIRVPVAKAEMMLDTKYSVWQHSKDGDFLVRTTSYSVPDDLDAHITLVQPTTMFARPARQRATYSIVSDQVFAPSHSNGTITNPVNGITVDASCNTTVTITCLQQLYNTVGYNSSATNGNQFGITGYLKQYANMEDLQSFYADQRPDALNSTFTVISVNGGTNNQTLDEAGGEACLDTQYGFGLTYPTPGTFWTTAGSPPWNPDRWTPTDTNEPYADWLDYVLAQSELPQTISNSYGDTEQSVPEDYAQLVCESFAQLGARGVSVLFASGDYGVGDGQATFNIHYTECLSNDGLNRTTFLPSFPASCPYVTSVGSTTGIPETATTRFYSGGGFSNYFARPSYQDDAVSAFFEQFNESTYAGLYNSSGRAIPDVSAQGDYFSIYRGGRVVSIGGTSASTPTFSAIVTLLNDALISSGKSPLGFLNPMLYTVGAAGLNDITVGNNTGCGTPGFPAVEGYDPVTGLGTPDFQKLLEIVSAQ